MGRKAACVDKVSDRNMILSPDTGDHRPSHVDRGPDHASHGRASIGAVDGTVT